MRNRKIWFTIDLDAELRKAGIQTNERFGKIEIYTASEHKSEASNPPAPAMPPPQPSVFVDEDGRLRFN